MYELDMSKDVPIILWNYVFETLSFNAFDELYKLLRFPIKPTPKLQIIAQDFVITFAKIRGVDSLFVPSNDLILTTDTKMDKSQILFQETFNILEQENLADAVYRWGKKTHGNYNYIEVASLLAWSRLLKECAIIQAKQNGFPINNNISAHKIKLVVDYWMSVYQNPGIEMPDISPPPFNKSQLNAFYNIIFQYEYERLMLKHTIDKIISQPSTAWHKFIYLKSLLGGWLSIEGKFRISLDEWSQLTRELEIEAIENWTKQYIEHYEDLILPLPSF